MSHALALKVDSHSSVAGARQLYRFLLDEELQKRSIGMDALVGQPVAFWVYVEAESAELPVFRVPFEVERVHDAIAGKFRRIGRQHFNRVRDPSAELLERSLMPRDVTTLG